MSGSWNKLLLRCTAAAALAIGLVSGPATAAAPPVSPSIASAAAFDVLLKRLEYGDLAQLDTERQLTYLEQLKQLAPAGDSHRQRLYDSQRCNLAFKNANKQGFEFADAQLASALAAGDEQAAARFYYCRGNYREALNTPRDAVADFELGITAARHCGDDALLASGLEARGGEFSLLGVHGKALADLLEAQRLYTQLELSDAATSTLQSIGIAYRRLGYPDKAREYLTQSAEHAQAAGEHETLFVSLIQLGYADEEAQRYDKALATDQRAIDIATGLDDRASMGAGRLAIASVLTQMKRYGDALDALTKAEGDFAAAGDLADDGMVQFVRGRALAGLGQRRKALESFQRAAAAFDVAGNPRYQEMLRLANAQTLDADGQAQAALLEFKRYIEVHDQVERARADQQAQMLRAQFDADRSNLENARLKTEQLLKDRQVESLERVRTWQQFTLLLSAALIGLLALLIIRQLRKVSSWKRMASIDPLTGAANRRGVEQFTGAAMRQARSRRESLSVLAVDLDRFKQINDSFGHAAGDRVLQHIARACQDLLREGDLLGRIGGEEFLVVLPNTTLEDANDVAERLRSHIEQLILTDLPAGLRTTISVGVAAMMPRDSGFGDLEQRADDALYRAKAEGRNRVVCASASSTNQELGGAAGVAAATGGGTLAS